MGKTTLLAHWAAQEDAAVFWYRAAPGDAVPGQMLTRFGTALSTVLGGEPARSLPEVAVMAEKLHSPLYFVVDDLHVLTGTCAESELEQLLLLDSPQLHFLVGSRRPPSFNLARSELPSFVTVGPDELRFRAPEVEQLFRISYRQPLSAAGNFNLTRRTDGWPAALHLFHTATKSRSTVERRRAAESLGQTPRYAEDYLTNHVLAGATPDMLSLLRQTCLLDRLTPARCDVLLDTSGSGLLLNELAELGILVRDGSATAFRLPEVLRQHLIAGLGDSGQVTPPDIRQRTSNVFEREGEYGAALRILAEGEDWENVRRLMDRIGRRVFLPGTCRWAGLAPESLTSEDPRFVLAVTRSLLDDGCAVGAYWTAAEVPRLTGDPEYLRLAGELRANAAPWAGDQQAAGPGPSGVLRAASHGSPRSAARSVHNPHRSGDTLAKSITLLLAGDQRGALPFLRRCAESPDDEAPAPLAAQLALAVLGPDAAPTGVSSPADEIDAVQRRADHLGFTWLARLAQGVQASLFGGTGRQDAVQAVVEECELRGDEWGAALVAAADALVRLRSGKSEYFALEALAARFRRLDAGALEAWALSAQALVGAVQDLPGAGEEALTAEAFARAADVPGALAVAYAAMAETRPDRRSDLMQVAAETAKSAGFVCRPWTWIASETQSTPPAKSGPGPVSTAAGSKRATPSSEAPSLRALDIRCFGGFSVVTGGVAVDLSRVRPQARTVLRILALHAGRPVHRDRLAGELWADLDPPSALHNLQVSVSSLRRALQAAGLATEMRQVIVRQGEAYALVLNGGSTFDLSEFDQAIHDASVARSTGNHELAAVKLRHAVDLYAGEVLPEDGSAEWVIEARERYQLRAAEAAASLASLELSLGNNAAAAAAAARSIEIDPWRDESWRTLIGIYRSSGDPAAAEHAERRYRGMLMSLGVPLNQGFTPET
jgi:DNA-binding SARP family transcriptional activator